MRLSPLQLQRVQFISVAITPRDEPDVLNPGQEFEPFQFNETRVLTTIQHAVTEDTPESKHDDFLLTFGFTLPNDGKNPPPYIVDIKCVGYFTMAKAASPDPVVRLDIGVVNGASMLYGIIREMVSSITSRSWYGPLLLPSANFQDHRPSLQQQQQEETEHSSLESKEEPKKSKAKKTTRPAKKTTKSE